MSEPTSTMADAWLSSHRAMLNAMLGGSTFSAASSSPTESPVHQQFNELQTTWQESITKWTDHLKQSLGAPMTPEAMRDLFTPSQWSGVGAGSFDVGLRQVLEGPKYATFFDQDRKLLELALLAAQRDRDVAAFQAIVQRAWNTACERFSVASFKEKPAPSTWRATADRWLATVNDTLIEHQRTDAFVEAQSKMLRSASDYRLQERKIAEAWCETFHIPTRTEMDEMQRTVTELRRMLRASQRAMAKPLASSASAQPAPRKRVAPKISTPKRV